MRAERFAYLVLALATACRTPSQTEVSCRANDKGVTAQSCYDAAWDEAYPDGTAHGQRLGYDAGYKQCKADEEAADTADTGGG
jgi:hypothetical protein